MDLTVTQQGNFVATGNAIIIPLRGGVDWMRVWNFSSLSAPVGAAGQSFYWQSGLPAGDGLVTVYNAGATADYTTTAGNLGVGGFTYIDSSMNIPGPLVAYSAGTNATPPVITTASTANLSTGNIVRIVSSTTANNASGIDYSIEVLSGTTFSLRNMSAPGSLFGTGNFRVIAFNPLFYPRDRVITNISAAAQAVVSTSVDSGYQVGDLVRLSFPGGTNATTLWGNYGQLDQQIATVVAVTPATAGNPATFTINVNTTGYGAFAWPVVANVAFTYPQVFAFGFYTDATTVTTPAFPVTNPNLLLDATFNTGFIGMQLAAGSTQNPGGAVGNIMGWQAGTTFNPNTIQPLVLM